ncbi:MAG: ATP-binding protein [Deferrisomatales bacterium]|nr:ATP-binding protein [Deferrisomatales bacterium]
MPTRLDPLRLRRRVDPDQFPFETTADLSPQRKPLGQERALQALEFGVGVDSQGYNIFVLGHPGAGKRTTVLDLLGEAAGNRPVPEDWVCVFNFEDEERPLSLDLPAGSAEGLRQDMDALVKSLLAEIPKAFSGDGYEKEKASVVKAAQEEKAAVFRELENLANQHGFLVQRSAEGLALIYTRDGSPVSQEDFEKLPAEEQQAVREAREVLQAKLRTTIEAVKDIDDRAKETLKDLERRVALSAVGHEIEALVAKYAALSRVVDYLKAVEKDVIENLDEFRSGGQEGPSLPFPFRAAVAESRTKRYQVNILVNNKGLEAAPVVHESNPTYHNLIGRIEHHVQLGAFTTDFTLVKAGAFHRANGGYLVLDARDLLLNPFAYDALKRVLKDRRIRIEEIGEQFRLISTTTLKPEPIPARVKVVLVGTPWLYYLLRYYDDDFAQLFKVKGEFSDDMPLTEENRLSYAFLVAHQCAEESLLPFHRDAVAGVVEHGLRAAEHQERLASHHQEIVDLVREAHHWARGDEAAVVRAGHVDRAVAEKIRRNSYLEEVIGRLIEEGTIVIEADGSAIGQVNGLSVYDLGDYAFGKPSRVTAKVFLGKEGVVNIERESDLGGRIHNKGMLILQGYFGSRYARRFPIAFAATLCFEQSYGGVEGDSASSAELLALISALGEVPLRQDLAVTGSVDQRGSIQAIGGVNLKIEGFYKTCKVKGLTGTQGVVIPQANVRNLMLDREVVTAVEEGRFHVYPVATVDEALELLTGLPAGDEDPYGNYPEGSVNAKVMRRLERLAELWKKLHSGETA